MKFTVCIPMYNEAKIIADTAKTLSEYMSGNFDEYEIIFSDDGSRDGSVDIVKNLELPNVCVIGYPDNRGKGSAVREAMLASTGDAVMFTDADLAYGTDVIKKVAEAFESNPDCDLVVGSRNLDKSGYEGYTLLRKVVSKCYIGVLKIVGGLKISDSQYGCKAFSGRAAKRVFSHCEVNRFAFDFEAILIAGKCGYKIKEIPVKVINHNDSKINIVRDSVKMLRDILQMKKRISKLDL
jgi:dolichyl-phosphate beta-glucosyltransferase